jgi:hypothetical protein
MKAWRATRLKLIGFLVVSVTVILLAILGFSTYLVNNVYLPITPAYDPARDGIPNKSFWQAMAGSESTTRFAIINEKATVV